MWVLTSGCLCTSVFLNIQLARARACNAHRASNRLRNAQRAREIQRASETSQRVSQSQRASERVNSGFWCILGTSTCSESFGELQRASERCNRRHWKANTKLQLFKNNSELMQALLRVTSFRESPPTETLLENCTPAKAINHFLKRQIFIHKSPRILGIIGVDFFLY